MADLQGQERVDEFFVMDAKVAQGVAPLVRGERGIVHYGFDLLKVNRSSVCSDDLVREYPGRVAARPDQASRRSRQGGEFNAKQTNHWQSISKPVAPMLDATGRGSNSTAKANLRQERN